MKKSKRYDGRYTRNIIVGRKADGKPIRKYFYASTVKELDRLVADYKRKMSEGTLSSNENIVFEELSKLWQDSSFTGLSNGTKVMYQGIIKKHLLPALAFVKAKELKPFHLQNLLNKMAENGYSKQTVKVAKTTANQILQCGLINDLIARNVFDLVSLPKNLSHSERQPLSDQQFSLVLQTWTGHRMGLPTLIMSLCGLRRGELIALTWNDVDVKNKTITVNKSVEFLANKAAIKTPKTESGIRTVKMPDIVFDAMLCDKRDKRSSKFVCPSAKGELMSQAAFKRAWDSYMHYLNICAGGRVASRSNPAVKAIDTFTPHQCRHTYATLLDKANTDYLFRKSSLGHSDVKISLDVYTHLSDEVEERSLSALNNLLEKHNAVKTDDESIEN